jgi:hypothetical protein
MLASTFIADWAIHWSIELCGTAGLACATGQCRNPLHLYCQLRQAFSSRPGRRAATIFAAFTATTSLISVWLVG